MRDGDRENAMRLVRRDLPHERLAVSRRGVFNPGRRVCMAATRQTTDGQTAERGQGEVEGTEKPGQVMVGWMGRYGCYFARVSIHATHIPVTEE